jgi:hypothetical protein
VEIFLTTHALFLPGTANIFDDVSRWRRQKKSAEEMAVEKKNRRTAVKTERRNDAISKHYGSGTPRLT